MQIIDDEKAQPADINAKSSRGECQHENFLTTAATAEAELLAKVLTDKMKLVDYKQDNNVMMAMMNDDGGKRKTEKG